MILLDAPLCERDRKIKAKRRKQKQGPETSRILLVLFLSSSQLARVRPVLIPLVDVHWPAVFPGQVVQRRVRIRRGALLNRPDVPRVLPLNAVAGTVIRRGDAGAGQLGDLDAAAVHLKRVGRRWRGGILLVYSS